jgi:transposase
MLANNSILSSRGARKYIDVSIKDSPKLRNDKITDDEKWDGFYGIETSSKVLSAHDVAEAYHQLWVVEESFRILKHHFETRPMFHWTPKRIIGHLTLSYIAFLFERTLELRLKGNSVNEVTHDRIREALTSMEISIIDSKTNKLQICSKHNQLAELIILTFNLNKPMNCKV